MTKKITPKKKAIRKRLKKTVKRYNKEVVQEPIRFRFVTGIYNETYLIPEDLTIPFIKVLGGPSFAIYRIEGNVSRWTFLDPRSDR